MNNFNINENTMNKLKDMMNKGDLSQIMSQIPPDMIQNFSSMMQNNGNNMSGEKKTNANHNVEHTKDFANSSTYNNSNNTMNGNNSSNNFDFSNIDMNTILKIKSVMEQMNNNNDPRSNLLHSLKPYLRDSKKEKLDQYANLMNVAKIAELFKNDNKENSDNG